MLNALHKILPRGSVLPFSPRSKMCIRCVPSKKICCCNTDLVDMHREAFKIDREGQDVDSGFCGTFHRGHCFIEVCPKKLGTHPVSFPFGLLWADAEAGSVVSSSSSASIETLQAQHASSIPMPKHAQPSLSFRVHHLIVSWFLSARQVCVFSMAAYHRQVDLAIWTVSQAQ